MNIIDFTKTGGYRLKQFTFRKMQEAYMQILKMFVAFCDVPETGNYIIQGCKVVGPNITSGYMYIDGELCYFAQAAGDLTTKIKKNVVTQSLGFKNGNSEMVFRFTTAVIDPTGVLLSDFNKVSPVFDADYVHTDTNFTQAEKDKLEDIEANAQVNVIPSWTAPSGDPSYIDDKPVGELLTKLYSSYVIIGDLDVGNSGLDDTLHVTFPDIGTDNYEIIPTFISQHTGVNGGIYDNDFTSIFRNLASDGFDIVLSELEGWTQNIKMKYTLIPSS